MPGCHTTELLLSCPPGEMVIIHSASFTSSRAKLNCSQVTRHSQRVDTVSRAVREGDSDIRRFVTRRCSGYSSGEECKFSLLLDVVESEVWGGGLVAITHTCVNTNTIRQTCSQDLNTISLVNTTVLMSPSYPRYYLSGEDCSWQVRLLPHQALLLRVLDLQLRPAGKDRCVDSLSIDNKEPFNIRTTPPTEWSFIERVLVVWILSVPLRLTFVANFRRS